jgi:hypothetical protein
MSDSSTQNPIVETDGYRIGQVQDRALRLESLLRQHGIELPSKAALEAIALSVFEVLYQREGGSTDEAADIRDQWKHLIGMNELAGMILGVKDHPEFRKLVPALRLLNQGVSIQNMPSPVRDQATNKVFELFAGILALHSGGSDIELDDDKAHGRNPDVLVSIDGRRWGIACKALHGDSPEGFIVHLEKAIDQIEKSAAEVGVVLFTIKNLLDQSKYWSITNAEAVKSGALPLFSAFPDPQYPFQILVADANAIGNVLKAYLPAGYLEAVFKCKKCLPGFLVWASVVTAVVFDDRPVPTSARVMTWQHVSPIEAGDLAVLERLHNSAYVADRD